MPPHDIPKSIKEDYRKDNGKGCLYFFTLIGILTFLYIIYLSFKRSPLF